MPSKNSQRKQGKPRSFEWNQEQLKIAKLLIEEKLSPKEVEKLGYSHTVVYRLWNGIKAGATPPSLDDDYIAKASPPTSFGQQMEKRINKTWQEEQKVKPGRSSTEEDTSSDGDNKKGGKSGTKGMPYEGTLLKLVPATVTCPLTPIMQNAKLCAINELKWRADMPWENFFDTCLVYLFHLWGFILEGYIVMEESDFDNDGHQEEAGVPEW